MPNPLPAVPCCAEALDLRHPGSLPATPAGRAFLPLLDETDTGEGRPVPAGAVQHCCAPVRCGGNTLACLRPPVLLPPTHQSHIRMYRHCATSLLNLDPRSRAPSLCPGSAAFEELFCACYVLLDRTWLEMGASYMQFPTVLK